MFKVVGRLRCPVCREPVHVNDLVFIDIANGIIHQKCHYKSPAPQIPIQDAGTFRKMLLKYPFFK